MITRGDRPLGLVMVAPAVVVLAIVTLYPTLAVLALSLQRRVPVFGISEVIGFANYRFLARDPAFWDAARVTLTFTVVSVAIETVLGVAVALVLRDQVRYRTVAIGLLLLPWCLPGVVTARTFEWLFHPTGGLVSANWLGDPGLALAAVTIADVWRTMPFVALLTYARLLTIPDSIYEAAAVDGAGGFTMFRAMTLPMLAPVLLVTTLFRTLDALRVFDLVFVLTGGGPAGTTETLTLYAYRNFFQTLELGFGAAIATVVFALVGATAWLYLLAIERADATT